MSKYKITTVLPATVPRRNFSWNLSGGVMVIFALDGLIASYYFFNKIKRVFTTVLLDADVLFIVSKKHRLHHL